MPDVGPTLILPLRGRGILGDAKCLNSGANREVIVS
jgi:hypothetical protein